MGEQLVYPAIAERSETGGLGIYFPDLPGCVTAVEHDDLNAAESAAEEALSLHIEGMVADGETLPRPTHYNRIGPEEVDMTTFRSILLIGVEAKVAARAPVVERFNATLPQMLLHRIDREVQLKKYPSRSGFLAEAARKLLAGG